MREDPGPGTDGAAQRNPQLARGSRPHKGWPFIIILFNNLQKNICNVKDFGTQKISNSITVPILLPSMRVMSVLFRHVLFFFKDFCVGNLIFTF